MRNTIGVVWSQKGAGGSIQVQGLERLFVAGDKSEVSFMVSMNTNDPHSF